MVLNPDCVRDTLLTIEERPFGVHWDFSDLCDKLPNYSSEQLTYTCLQLFDGNFLNILPTQTLSDATREVVAINDLTYSGHQLLNSIRPPTNWEKVKKALNKVEIFSLPTMIDIIKEILTSWN